MDIERLRAEAEKFAQFRLEKIEQGRAVIAAIDIAEGPLRTRLMAERNAEIEAEMARFEELRPQLEEEARKEHNERFKPLQDLLAPFEEPVRQVRDAYFPDSKIAVADHYDGYYGISGHNVYYRGLLVPDDGGFVDQGKRLFGVYAVVIEDPKWETIYGIDISVTYQNSRLPKKATEDMQYVTPDEDLFTVDRDSFWFHSSHFTPEYTSIRGRERIDYQREADGSFIMKSLPSWSSTPSDPEARIERRFMGVLRRIEVDNILVRNGLGFHSQFSAKGSSCE